MCFRLASRSNSNVIKKLRERSATHPSLHMDTLFLYLTIPFLYVATLFSLCVPTTFSPREHPMFTVIPPACLYVATPLRVSPSSLCGHPLFSIWPCGMGLYPLIEHIPKYRARAQFIVFS